MPSPAHGQDSSSIITLAGPTASGKSEVALLLAQRLNGEIVSVDSMQVYRGMDIGTAKPSAAERAIVPHHLIDVVDISEPFDAARFARAARQAVSEIHRSGRTAILCGGTGLYFKAFFEGVGTGPAADPALRAELEETPMPALLDELAARDPETFAKIDRANPRRVARAIEVIRLTGKPFSQQRASWSSASIPDAFGIQRETKDLHTRIDQRVDAMFANGLVEETKRLLDQGLLKNRTAMQALGYRQVVEFLREERSLPETIELVKLRTRQFAKRQMTWFRHQMKLHWVNASPDDAAAAIVERILPLLQR